MDFNDFLKFSKNTDFYDLLMEQKEQMDYYLTSKEFMCLYFINCLINDKKPAHQIIPKVPKEYHHLLKKTLKARLKPERLVVDWTTAKKTLTNVLHHNLCVEDKQYFQNYFPCRTIKV